MVTFTYEAPKSVDALPAMRTHTAARHTLVDVWQTGRRGISKSNKTEKKNCFHFRRSLTHTGASVGSQLQPGWRAGASDHPLHHLAAVLTVSMETGASVLNTIWMQTLANRHNKGPPPNIKLSVKQRRHTEVWGMDSWDWMKVQTVEPQVCLKGHVERLDCHLTFCVI